METLDFKSYLKTQLNFIQKFAKIVDGDEEKTKKILSSINDLFLNWTLISFP